MFNEKRRTIADSSCFCHTIGRNKSITPLLIKNKKTWKILISEKVMDIGEQVPQDEGGRFV